MWSWPGVRRLVPTWLAGLASSFGIPSIIHGQGADVARASRPGCAPGVCGGSQSPSERRDCRGSWQVAFASVKSECLSLIALVGGCRANPYHASALGNN
ncbi:hypothetical protein LY78DRAFT_290671 [Colletotrichum sublineola]|nr:hypothetical protein LY78DRAFT_290671 [Colletotrichum sublineola]